MLNMRLYSVAASWTCFLDCSVALCSVVSSRPQSKPMWELEGYIAVGVYRKERA